MTEPIEYEAEMQVGRVPATQTLHPWRAVVRTIVAALPAVPLIVTEAGVDGVPWVASGLAAIAVVTRVLAIPAVENFLREYVPWLSAQPRDY